MNKVKPLSIITNGVQTRVLIKWVGNTVFELLKNLFGVDSLHEKAYTPLNEKLTLHFQAKGHIVAARFEFYMREMRDSQTHTDWVADLRRIARECVNLPSQ